MTVAIWVDISFWVFAVAAILTGWRVFETDSMVRASFLLLLSFLNVGAILLLLTAEYLGFALLFMMAVEMVAMALFMVMFMMNPAGLNPMEMVHQKPAAMIAGVLTFTGVSVVAVFGEFPNRPVRAGGGSTRELGLELLGDSMMVFESAGVALLATMIGAIVLALRTGRFGAADEDSVPPPIRPEDSHDDA
ncbi:MAG: NADH-quinone oxidoreductase subunit J [Actinobacteria bacterium]|nr:NADH-quinone oxidoreductase subunit J [Actinomycetota bacterium]